METGPLTYMTSTAPTVAVVPDAESLAVAAAGVIVATARDAVKKSGRFTIVLSGGSTPRPVYELLAAPPLSGLIPWDATYVFWGDERCVDAADPRSNQGMARRALLDHVPIPAGNIHPVECPGPQGGSDPALREAAARQAAAEYEKRLREFFGAGAAGFDLVLLGLGNDGHTASLLPRSDVLEEREGWVAATPETIGAGAVAEGAIRDTSERPWRVTLTAPLINRAGLVLFLVSGASKAGAVKAALDGDPDFRELPAILIRPASGRVQWLLDEDAASALEGKTADESAGARSPAPVTPAAVAGEAEPIEEYEDLPGCGLGFSR